MGGRVVVKEEKLFIYKQKQFDPVKSNTLH